MFSFFQKKGFIMSVNVNGANWKLPQKLIALSVSNVWNTAVNEWKLIAIEVLKQGEALHTCLCGHFPIRKICHVRNMQNGNESEIGNCCIKLFKENCPFVGVHKIFDSCDKLKKDPQSLVNLELIQYAYDREIISEWDKNFYKDIWRKRKITDSQFRVKMKINRKILLGIILSVGEMFRILKQDPNETAGPKLIELAYNNGIINKNNRDFYLDIWNINPDILSDRQKKYKRDLNIKITAASNLQYLMNTEENESLDLEETQIKESVA